MAGESYKKIEVKTIKIPGFGSYTGPIKILESKMKMDKQVTKGSKSPGRAAMMYGGMAKGKKKMNMGGMMYKKGKKK
jgi:hypothetical protein